MRVFIASENEAVNAKIQSFLVRKGHDCIWANLSAPDKVAGQLIEANPSFSIVVLSPEPVLTPSLLALCRAPTGPEIAMMRDFLAREGGDRRALEQLCRVIFNLNEFAYAD